MTFPNDGTCVVEKQYSDEEISAVLAESRQARKHLRKWGKVTEIVAAYRLKELKHLQAVEKLATWKKACGFDRLAEGDNSWVHGTRPPTPEEFTTSLWSDLKELKDAVSMPTRDGFSQRAKSFIKKIGQGTVNLKDAIGQSTVNLANAELAMLKRFVERRGRDAAHVTCASVDTAQHCDPRSPSSEPSFDACVCADMEKKDEGTMDPERDQLEPPSVSTGLETPGQQCPRNGETGRTTADGCLLVGVGSNLERNTFPPAEIAVGTRPDSESATPPAASNIIFLQASRNSEDKTTVSEEKSNLTPAGKEETHRFRERL